MKTLALMSGGMDSTVLVGHLLDQGDEVTGVGFDYGQRHRLSELAAAVQVAAHYGIEHALVDLSAVGKLLSGSALTDDAVDVPLGHYADESMRATVVPNRNAIMLMIAVGIASARGFDRVATAVHAGDHFVYPDCRPEFIAAVDVVAERATDGFGNIAVIAPFVRESKTWIAAHGMEIGAPLALTWSCYQGGTVHCGQCGTCVERKEAFADSGVADPTTYADGDRT